MITIGIFGLLAARAESWLAYLTVGGLQVSFGHQAARFATVFNPNLALDEVSFLGISVESPYLLFSTKLPGCVWV